MQGRNSAMHGRTFVCRALARGRGMTDYNDLLHQHTSYASVLLSLDNCIVVPAILRDTHVEVGSKSRRSI